MNKFAILIQNNDNFLLKEATLSNAKHIFDLSKESLSADILNIINNPHKNFIHAQRIVSMFNKIINDPEMKETTFNKYMRAIFTSFVRHTKFEDKELKELIAFCNTHNLTADNLRRNFVEFDIQALKTLTFIAPYVDKNTIFFKYENDVQAAYNYKAIENNLFKKDVEEIKIVKFIINFTTQYLTQNNSSKYMVIPYID